MFENLTEKLTIAFSKLSSKGRLTEADVDEALREVRLALLEADVNFKVARELIVKIKDRAIGMDILKGIAPQNQVVKIVHEELVQLLSSGNHNLQPGAASPNTILLVGLQGSGKTTTAAKLAHHLRKNNQRTHLIAADLRRPAAIEQLISLGKQLDIPVYSESPDNSDAVKVSENGIKKAKDLNAMWTILDTSGRIQVDDELMSELEQIKKISGPAETLLVVDSMTGQDAVNIAEEFNRRIGLTGLILSKLDGDARGGAAITVTHVTGVPIKFIGVGEKTDALESFHPDRMASRILGMGDVLTLVEKAQEQIAEEDAKELERKIRKAQFDLEDFLKQIKQVQKMGSLSSIMEMVPGFSAMRNKLPQDAMDDGRLKRIEALISSMTLWERQHPEKLNGSRKRRIAIGSGSTPAQVNQLLNQFQQTQKVMKQVASGKMPGNLFSPGRRR